MPVYVVDPAADEDSKAESAYRMLRHSILSVELEPGVPLRPSRLQERYGIGWTPLREALARLEAERLVTMQRNRGFSVAPVSRQELEDLTRARCALELGLLEESIAEGASIWEDQLIVAHYRLKDCTLRVDAWNKTAILKWLDQHQSFHRALLSGGKSQWLLHFYDQVMDQERRQYLALMLRPALKALEIQSQLSPTTPLTVALADATDIHLHTELMEAVLARDIGRAVQLTKEHLRYKGDIFNLV